MSEAPFVSQKVPKRTQAEPKRHPRGSRSRPRVARRRPREAWEGPKPFRNRAWRGPQAQVLNSHGRFGCKGVRRALEAQFLIDFRASCKSSTLDFYRPCQCFARVGACAQAQRVHAQKHRQIDALRLQNPPRTRPNPPKSTPERPKTLKNQPEVTSNAASAENFSKRQPRTKNSANMVRKGPNKVCVGGMAGLP